MRTLLIILAILFASPSLAFTVAEPYQPDFDQAVECRGIDGRKVWKGEKAFYIQAWLFQTGQSGLLDDEAASVVPIADNAPENLQPFAEACD